MWKSYWKRLWLRGQVGWSGVLENHQGWANSVSHLNREHRFRTHLMKGELTKGTVVPASAYIPGESCAGHCPPPQPSGLALKLVNLVLPYMSLALFKLLPLC